VSSHLSGRRTSTASAAAINNPMEAGKITRATQCGHAQEHLPHSSRGHSGFGEQREQKRFTASQSLFHDSLERFIAIVKIPNAVPPSARPMIRLSALTYQYQERCWRSRRRQTDQRPDPSPRKRKPMCHGRTKLMPAPGRGATSTARTRAPRCRSPRRRVSRSSRHRRECPESAPSIAASCRIPGARASAARCRTPV
jgi:hypothetical protein